MNKEQNKELREKVKKKRMTVSKLLVEQRLKAFMRRKNDEQ